MNYPQYGIFSTNTMLLHRLATEEHQERFLKKAAILFEKLIIVPILRIHNIIENKYIMPTDNYVGGWYSGESKYKKDFINMFILITDFLESSKEFYEKLNYPTSYDLWAEENIDKFISFMQKLFRSDFDDPYKIEYLPDNFASYIADDCKLFQIASQDITDCSSLISEYHESAMLAILSKKFKNPYKVATILSDINTFDFADLSWRDIFILRKNNFINDFRNKLWLWITDYSNSNDLLTFQKSLNQYIRDCIFDLISDSTPNIRMTTLSGIGSNIPISPLNPIGLVTTIKSIKDAYKLNKKYSWLYFIARARKKGDK